MESSGPDAAAAARERAREQVRAAFATAPQGPAPRRCLNCGAEHATDRGFCPDCSRRYDRALPWLTDRMRWGVGAAAAIAVVAAGALILPGVFDAKRAGDAERARAQAELVAAESARLIREQRPQRARSTVPRPPAGASDARLRAARAAVVADLEGAILADARSRVARGQLDGPIKAVECGPLVRATSTPPDEQVLTKALGRYDCVAAKADVIQGGEKVATLGHPFVATIDFRRFTYVWCKDNKAPGESGKALATVALDPSCLGAEGAQRVGNGYAQPED